MCHNLILHLTFIIALTPTVRARDVYYITSALTECFAVAPASDSLSHASAQPGNPSITSVLQPPDVASSNLVYSTVPPADSRNPEESQPPEAVTYSMPPCAVCDCPNCTTTSVFTTTLPHFNSYGLTERPYIVTETYVGMSSLPYFPKPTPVPYGFTTAVETCTNCGAQPISHTIVTPKAARPCAQDISGVGTRSGGVLSETSGAASPIETVTRSASVGNVETTLITVTEHNAETTWAGGQHSAVSGGDASTEGRLSTAPPSYVHVSAAELFERVPSLLYIVVISTICAVVLFR